MDIPNLRKAILLPATEQVSLESFLDRMVENVEKQSLCCGFHASLDVIHSVGSPFDSIAALLDNQAKQKIDGAITSSILMAYFLDRLGCPKVPITYSRSFRPERVSDMEEWADLVLIQIALNLVPILSLGGASNIAKLLASYYFFVQDSAKEIFHAPTV